MRVNENYEKKVHKILKTYDSVLVRCKNIPIQIDKNVVMVSSIEGMVNAQIETRKPILYYKEDDSMSFILLDGTEIYVYIIKKYQEKECAVENVINNFNDIRNTFLKELASKFQNILLEAGSKSNNSENYNYKNDNLLSFDNINSFENLSENKKEQNFNDNTINNNFQMNSKNLQDNNSKFTNSSETKKEVKKNDINNNLKNNNEKSNNNEQTNVENDNQNINSSNELSLALIKKRKRFSLFGRGNKSKRSGQGKRKKNKRAI